MDRDQDNNAPINSRYATPFDVDKYSGSNYSSMSFFQKVGSLPESIKDIMANPSTADFIEDNLGPSFNLTNEQKTEITRIIRDVLLGDISINAMTSKISENLGIDPTTAYQIQGKIVNELFGSTIEDIKKMQKEELSPVKPSQPRYIPPPPRNQEPPVSPGNVVDLRNQK